MSNPYETSFIQTLQDFAPGILKALSALLAMVMIFLGINNVSGNTDDYVFEKDFVRDYSIIAGNKESKVQFVYFVDLQCPACKANESALKEIETEFKDRVSFVYRNYTLTDIHPYAEPAAKGGQAAARQDINKYFDYKNRVFAVQESLSVDNIVKAARDSGLDMDRWNKDRQSSEIAKEVSYDLRDIRAANLPKSTNRPDGGKATGTPTTVLLKNGEVVDSWTGGLAKEAQKTAIEAALKE